MPMMRNLTVTAATLMLSHMVMAGNLNSDDMKYVKKTAQGLMAEVEMGKMAEKQAADEHVKQFGHRMVKDHGKDLQHIQELASRKHLVLPDAPEKKQRMEADRLSKLSGAAFDKEYVRYEAKDHEEDVEENGKTMKKAADPDVKNFASAEYEVVSTHKKMVDDLENRLRK